MQIVTKILEVNARNLAKAIPISKNYCLRPERPVHLTHGTLGTQTDVLDATSDRHHVRKIPVSSSHILTPSGHGPLRPVRPDDV